MQEVYTCPCLPVEAPRVNNNNLDIFTHNVPFNFAVKQAIDQLDNLEALAKVA
jgi:hypothetical protein